MSKGRRMLEDEESLEIGQRTWIILDRLQEMCEVEEWKWGWS